MATEDLTLFSELRQCSKCEHEYPATTEFFFFDNRGQRLYRQCKTCCGKKGKRWQENNREKSRGYTHKWRTGHLEEAREADALLHREKRLTQGDHVRAVARAYTQRKIEEAGGIYHPKGTPLDPIVDGMKPCTGCEQSFPATTEYFQIQNRRACGLHSQCKTCQNARARAWQGAHREQCHKSSHDWYEKNKDRHAANGKRWRDANIEHAREYGVFAQQRRRAAMYEAGEFALTIAEWHMLKAHFNYCCQYCLDKFPSCELTMDHITPVSQGGSTTIQNIIPACKSCNSRKHAGQAPRYMQPLML